jgi:hypothetical protein
MDDLRDADLIVTTRFYARPVRAAAEALDKPFVILTTHPDFEAAIRRRLDEGQLTIVAVDPRFGDWFRAVYNEERLCPFLERSPYCNGEPRRPGA